MSQPIGRRKFLGTVSAGAAIMLPRFSAEAIAAERAHLNSADSEAKPAPKALIFDTFGTVVDWRGSIAKEGAAWGKAKGFNIDWAHFADRWRDGYQPQLEKVRKGQLRWTTLDVLNRALLEDLLKEFRLTGLTEQEKDHWNRVWHRLDPWPDSIAGLTRLKKNYIIAPLSNGNFSLLTDMAKRAGIPWDAILSAELAKHYKPDKEAYLTAASLLGLKPEETMMAAAHASDLKAARSFGLLTAFIYRPNEHGVGGPADKAKPGEFDVVARDMVDLAVQLGS